MHVRNLLESFKKSPETRDFVRYSRVKKPVYHGTGSDFESFEIDRSDLGPHFGNLEQANYITSNRVDSNQNIRPVYLQLENPLRLKDEGCFHADCIADQLLKKKLIDKTIYKKIMALDYTGRKETNALVRAILKDKGYDGVVYKNTHEGSGDSYIVFSPDQIKSVFS